VPIGQGASVKAAGCAFPASSLEPLEQVYQRLGEDIYRYESAGGKFTRDLTVTRLVSSRITLASGRRRWGEMLLELESGSVS